MQYNGKGFSIKNKWIQFRNLTIKKTPDTDPDQNLKGQKFPKEERVEEHFTPTLLGLREEFLFSQREGAGQFPNKFIFINAKLTIGLGGNQHNGPNVVPFCFYFYG